MLLCLQRVHRLATFRPLVVRLLSSSSSTSSAKTRQLETAKMSNLKRTHLSAFNDDSYRLFQEYVQTDEVRFLNDIFRGGGFEIRLAGGGVRDLLCRIVPHDIDFATDARPDDMIKMMSDKENIRLITTASGKRHGTVTARINNKVQYEITTLRIDKQTDGRHAEVEFVNDWKIDASRRDLTINSMFIDLNGTLYDYFGGKEDLDNREIRFVGETESRIREDYLRIFRYFRFHTRFGVPGKHDPATIETMKANVDGLEIISGERIWAEMKRILANIECTDSVEIMFTTLGIDRYMGFTTSPKLSLDEFHRTVARLRQYGSSPETARWKPQTLLAALMRDTDELCSVVARLKLANYERDTMAYILANRENEPQFDAHLLKTQLALAPKSNQVHLRDFILQYLYYSGAPIQFIDQIAEWDIPPFPFSGHMVANRVQKKRQISQLLDELKATWAKNQFDMSQEAMQAEVDRILERIAAEDK